MPAKKKTKKKTTKRQPTKSKRTAGGKTTAMKMKRSAKAKTKPKKKKAKLPTKGSAKKKSTRKQVRRKGQPVNTKPFPGEGRAARSGRQSGDLQGLSSIEGSDSESVDELLEEGNAFEADVVKGVEDAEDSDEKEVHTHEVPEDDVPEEYLDKE